jgi:hemoglobin
LSEQGTPTLYEWAGGAEALERLTERFYGRVRQDPLLEPIFRHMHPNHPQHVAAWIGEVFGGPPMYTEEHGGYPHMLNKHRGLGLTEQMRRRWVNLICDAADDAGLPSDPEFRSAFVAYIEWGTRLAVINSRKDAHPPERAPVPRWGWGEAPPYQPG